VIATTPTGSRRTMVEPDALGRATSRSIFVIRSAYMRSRPAGAAPLNADDSVIGMPFSWLTSLLVASEWASRASAKRIMTSARSAAVVRPQGPLSMALRAAWTAASMSASVPIAAVPSSSPVAASSARWVSVPCGSTHSPSMKKRVRSSSVVASAVTVTVSPGSRTEVIDAIRRPAATVTAYAVEINAIARRCGLGPRYLRVGLEGWACPLSDCRLPGSFLRAGWFPGRAD